MDYTLVDALAVHGAILFVLWGTGTCFLLNGHWWCAGLRRQHVIPMFAVLAFAISLLVNASMGVAFSVLRIPLAYAVAVLVIVNAVLIVRVWGKRKAVAELFSGTLTRPVLALLICVAAMFVVMLRNGGLIDIIADSWWHMGLVKKMEYSGSVFLERHHLTGDDYGASRMLYEPGWHVSLVYILAITKLPAPLIWHALASWVIAVTLCAYYLLAEKIANNASVAVVAAILLAFLLGGLNSYFRVSPWPGNVSYALWYFLLFLSLCLLENFSRTRTQFPGVVPELAFCRSMFGQQRGLGLLWGIGVASIALLHVAELALYILSILFYGLVLLSLDSGRRASEALLSDRAVLGRLVLFAIGVSVVVACLRAGGVYSVIVISMSVVMLVLAHGQAYRLGRRRWLVKAVAWVGIVTAAVFLVDIDHVTALFVPRTDSFTYYAYYIPEWQRGYFGEYVRVPFWEHQLRAGLLFSGLAGIAASIYLFLRRPGRGTAFLFGNAVIPMALLVAPYLFSYLFYFIPDRGVYRISLLIFHPISIAYLLYWVCVESGVIRGAEEERFQHGVET